MILMVKIPLAPIPVIHLPITKTSKLCAILLTKHPLPRITVAAKIHGRGPKIAASFPFRGPRALIAIK